MRHLFATLALLAPLACAAVGPEADPPTPATPAPSAAEQARKLFERDWQWQLRRAPERATGLGEQRHNALLSDTSLAARAAALEHEREMLEAAREIDRSRLEGQTLVSYDLFVLDKQQRLAAGALLPFDPQPLTAYDGLHVQLPRLVAQMPFAGEDDYRAYIARLKALPAHVDGLVEQLRAGLKAGWPMPKTVLRGVPDALRSLREGLQDGALAAPFKRIPAAVAPEVREELLAAGAAALNDSAAPALRKLEDFLRTDYLPLARDSIGASSLPNGAAWYALLVRQSTSTELTPAEIHAIGQKEVARLRLEVAALVPRTGFRGDPARFLVFARTDPRLFFPDAETLLGRYRRALARAENKLPKVVGTPPSAGLAVKPMTAAGAGQPAAYYEAGSEQRSAALVVNVADLGARPIWQVDTIALHEGLPGHHLQVARARELELPAFRRHGWFPAFGEGWATYAEGLGPELGFFQDPFSLFGHLNEQAFRAARLVVDTGIHALGWSRQQAVDYLNANTANPPADNEAEVDRYIARPAQALSYKIGQLRILALRKKARAALGERFDLRRFHDAVLGGGTLPLPLLERQVERWIAAETRPADAAATPAAAPVAPAAAPPPAPAAKPPAGSANPGQKQE
ncbi:DUF885 family protein [Massilia sp. ZL223]|uniref:DUF885 domain-containing protein n=1 Tax=Massilia sp. ZL223 TaxID=2824904 RepID=UPI001B83A67D|nr:DUF885 domain-containing protein [Massilia sp. ZL223]MBQ5962326.1 DUF885 domain-containing protein [Massilia sp. ZL223]